MPSDSQANDMTTQPKPDIAMASGWRSEDWGQIQVPPATFDPRLPKN